MGKIGTEIVSKLDQMIAQPPEMLFLIGRTNRISGDAVFIYNSIATEYNKLNCADDRRRFLKAIEVQIGISAED